MSVDSKAKVPRPALKPQQVEPRRVVVPSAMPTHQSTNQVLDLFKALSDETRLALMLLIHQHQELCVCELTEALQLSQPKVSRHLALLRDQQLLAGEKRGQWVHYHLHPQLNDWAQALISSTLEQVQSQQPQFLQGINQRLCKVSPHRSQQSDCC